MQKRIAEIDGTASEPNFWNDQESAQRLMSERKALEDRLLLWNSLSGRVHDLAELIELYTPNDPEYNTLIADSENLDRELARFELQQVLSEPDDEADCFLEIHSGAGGTEACDWAEMLLRMYVRWCERSGYDAAVLEITPGDEAGIKSAIVEVDGPFAYGYLKCEIGIHRLVRISPFDSANRRHTSFASVFAFPQVEADEEIEIDEKDLRIDTYRSSGHGGQHLNKTDSAVRITHIPTKVVVQCQNERSQHKNKAKAMKMLKARLKQKKEKEAAEQKARVESTKRRIEWGSQIRSYVLHPYNMVKDLRTTFETSNTKAVLDGDLDSFIRAYLLSGK